MNDLDLSDFARDDAWQRDLRDRILAPGFYDKYANGRYIFIDKGRLAKKLQKQYSIDTILQNKDGEVICIEEKIVRKPKYGKYPTFFLETQSCSVAGHESTGWMTYAESDYLFYCYEQASSDELDCYLIDLPKLQEWFWQHDTEFPSHTKVDAFTKPVGRLVPIRTVRANVPTWHYWVSAPSQVTEDDTDRAALFGNAR
jgi:hypothetical protein